MKKILAVAMSIMLGASLAACGGSSAPATTAAPAATTAAPAETKAAEETKAEETKAEETKAEETKAEETKAAESGSYETASGWPKKKNITLIVPAGAGGTMDLVARLVVAELEKELGATVVVENVPGGGMWIGLKQAINSDPDGYTFVIYNCPLVAIANYNDANPLEENPTYFTKICNDVVDYGALAIRQDDERYSDLESFIAYAKENPLVCTAGARGIANGDASRAEWFNMNLGTQIEVMTVDSSADGIARFYAGDTDCFFGSIGDLLTDKDAGIYKVIATFSEGRSELMPDVPCMQEMGYDFADYVARGFAFPAGVDQEIVDNMVTALSKACEAAAPKVLEMGMETHVVSGPEYEEMEKKLLEERLAIYGKTTEDKVVQ